MSKITNKIDELNAHLIQLGNEPGFKSAKKVIDGMIAFLDIKGEWDPFTDTRRRIFNNAHWFHAADGFRDQRATYVVADDNNKNLDLKAYWVKPKRKSIFNWVAGLTPNFEDEPFFLKDNVGIDFLIPDKADRVFVILSKRYVLRVLEVKDKIGPTQQEILARWTELNFDDKEKLHQGLWDSFDLQPVNKDFYQGIAERFYKLRDFLCEKDIFSKQDAGVFTMRLIGRVVFCWFLDKKGLIKNSGQYLSVQSGRSDKDYYQDTLGHLFFKLLNTPERDRMPEDKGVAPYLNGGLFEVHPNESLNGSGKLGKLDFPDGFFGDFFQFLKGYHFTTDESTSSFQQVAIDPEMMGKIFENLLAEQREETGDQARRARGAYYTPREVVDYMCKESLRNLLRQKLPDTRKANECLKKLFDTNWHEYSDQKSNYQRDYINPYKASLLETLDNVKILDPACGSGAFPLGMLHVMLDIYERINARGIEKRKLAIVENNIYGVDIDPMAVEISKLRVWLSLIIDTGGKAPVTLPNLEFKFVCADSLMSFGKDIKKTKVIEELQEDRKTYFKTSNPKTKADLRERMTASMKMLSPNGRFFDPFGYSTSCAFFDPNIMFGINEGLDIVIGNPPYIQLQKNGGFLADKYEDAGFSTFDRTGDIYQLFYEKGGGLLKAEQGILSYITSNSWLKAKYGKKTRHYFSKHCAPLMLMDMGKNIFENAIVDTNILIAASGGAGQVCKAVDMDTLADKTFPPEEGNWNTLYCQKDNPWIVISALEQSIMDKIKEVGTPLKKWDIEINYGIKTGYNKAFIIDDATKQALVAEDPKSAEIIKPVLRGRDIQRYRADWKNLWLIDTHNGYGNILAIDIVNYPAIKKHLDKFYPQLKKRHDKGKTPYNLRNCAYHEDFSKEKLLWIELVENGRFAYDNSGIYGSNTTFIMTGKSVKYLCAILNSKLVRWFLKQTATTSGMGTLRWLKVHVETVPIAQISAAKQSPFIALLDKILSAKDNDLSTDTSTQEAEIDNLVYKLYGLTPEEISAVEKQ